MYFGYTLISDVQKGDKVALAVISERSGTSPIPINALPYTESAICFLSQEEAFLVKPSEDFSIIIEAQKPAKIYLTPNRPEKPGYSVGKIRIFKSEEGKVKCQFDRDKGWQDFKPNEKEY